MKMNSSLIGRLTAPYRSTTYHLPLLFVLLLPRPSSAIELSLEENKGERGTIGFVDMERVFREHPETRRAKEEFEAEVHAKRVEIQRRKSEILDLKSELARLTVDRERLLKESLLEPAVLPAPSAPSSAAVTEAPLTSTAPLAPGATQAPPALLQTLPGLQPQTTAALSAGATGPAAAPIESPLTDRTTVAAPAPFDSFDSAQDKSAQGKPVPAAQRVQELEGVIAQKQQELAGKEKAFSEFSAQAQAELLELEKRRVQILLGRIYDVVQEVAKEEGVSVVVDKKAILYGQKAVDLTGKLLERIK